MKYKIISEAAEKFGQVDEVVELELSKDQELACVAAGWLEPVKKEKK